MWWSWVGYAWLTSVVNPEEGAVRLVVFAAMAAFLVVALCVPGAFGDEALLFACAYGIVRFSQIALFLLASRDDPGLRRAVWGLLASTAVGVGLLVAASFADGTLQGALWALALALDMGGPLLIDPAGWRLEPGHFAERHGLIVIIALGESIVAIGVGAEAGVTTGVVVAACVGIASPPRCGGCTSTSSRWSPSGGCRTPRRAASATRSRATRSPTCTCRWWPGIVLVALGLKKTLEHVDDPLKLVPAAALLGGAGDLPARPRRVPLAQRAPLQLAAADRRGAARRPAAGGRRDLRATTRRSWARCWRR